uniref:Cytidine and dCMP deaminase domain-containing protein 1 n=1 Tax=Oncorhynchus tshawytscha TaxID=74940 RepID=A0AAZ3QAH9_ONCTS
MDTKQQDRQRRKYRYIIHAEQNALTFRSEEIREEENTMLFVTKCPCDECVPLIRGAGIKQIYTTDLDSGKDKGDISYLRFHSLQGVLKFIWQKSSLARRASEHAGPHLASELSFSVPLVSMIFDDMIESDVTSSPPPLINSAKK